MSYITVINSNFLLTGYQVQFYMFTLNSLFDVVDKFAICHNLFLFVAFFFRVIVHVAKPIVFFPSLCMDG